MMTVLDLFKTNGSNLIIILRVVLTVYRDSCQLMSTDWPG
jgi:hypothetical protein